MLKSVNVTVNFVNTCLWCEDHEKPIPFDFMLCSYKCLNELRKAIEKKHGKGKCGYDASDVYVTRKLTESRWKEQQ